MRPLRPWAGLQIDTKGLLDFINNSHGFGDVKKVILD